MAAEFEPVRPELAGEVTDVIVEGEGDKHGEKRETIEGSDSIFRNGQVGMLGGESGRTCRLREDIEPEG